MHFSRIHLLSPSAAWTGHPRWTCSKVRVQLTSKIEYYLTSQERCGVLPGVPPLGGRKMKRLRTEAAETRRRIVRAAAVRFEREGNRRGRADEVERFGRAILV